MNFIKFIQWKFSLPLTIWWKNKRKILITSWDIRLERKLVEKLPYYDQLILIGAPLIFIKVSFFSPKITTSKIKSLYLVDIVILFTPGLCLTDIMQFGMKRESRKCFGSPNKLLLWEPMIHFTPKIAPNFLLIIGPFEKKPRVA